MTDWLKYGMLLLCFLVLSFGFVTKIWALEILYPQDGTYVTKSNYLIVHGGEEPLLDAMTIEIDGIKSELIDLSSEEYRGLYGDKLVVEPIYDPGVNTIVVEGYLSGNKIATAQAEVYYLADESETLPPGYRKEVFHLAEREAACAVCHNMQPSKAQLQNPAPSSNPCASCHARMLNRAHVHGPAGVYECSYCHDVESQPVKYQVRLDDIELCQECHDDQNVAPLLHGPVEAGMCLICHDSHATDQPGQLVAEVNQLCLNCHARVLNRPHVISAGMSSGSHPLSGPENPRDRGKRMNCSSCHDPHGGQFESYFVGGIESKMQLCQECHDK